MRRSLFSHGGCQAGLKCEGEGPLHFCSSKPKRGDYPLILSRESFSLHNYFPPSQSLTLASSPWKASLCPLTPSSAQPTPSLWQKPSSFQKSLRVSSLELFSESLRHGWLFCLWGCPVPCILSSVTVAVTTAFTSFIYMMVSMLKYK